MSHPIEEDYSNVLNIIKFMLREKEIYFLEAEEVLSETFIQTYKHPYTRQFFLSESKNVIREAIRARKYGNRNATDSDEKEKVCLKCKELLPIGNFGVTNVYRFGGSYYNSHCKECVRKNSSDYHEKRKQDPERHRAYLERRKRWKLKRKLEKQSIL